MHKSAVRTLQQFLADQDAYHASIDGVRGPRTLAAVNAAL